MDRIYNVAYGPNRRSRQGASLREISIYCDRRKFMVCSVMMERYYFVLVGIKY